MFANLINRAPSLLLLLLLCSVAHAKTGSCTQSSDSYESNNYKITGVRVDAPLNWLFGSVRGEIADILKSPQMPQVNQLFSKSGAQSGFVYLQSQFNELSVNPNVRVAFRIAWPSLRNCDDSQKTLEIVYKVYSFGAPYYVSRAFEDKKQELGRSVIDTPATKRLAKFEPLPFVGYNRSRNLYGGTTLSIRELAGPFDKINLEASGSSTSSTAKLDITGSRSSETGFIRYKEWHLKYQYSDLPSSTTDLKQGTLLGQFSGATRSYGSPELTLRFGGLIEGGNRQSNVDPARLGPTDVASSRYRGIKGFVGSSMILGGQSFKASYGIQVGNASDDLRADFVKQIFDTAYSVRFLPRPHRPINIDAQFTAGTIKTLGRLPVSERFFGGNVEQNFISDETWVIRSNPFIRSFPQNRLESIEGSNIIGADHFISANITLAATAWGYPLVPNEVLKDPDFPGAVQLEMSVAEGAIQYAYLSDTSEFKEIAALVKELPPVVAELKSQLNRIPNPNSNPNIQAILDELFIPPPTPEQNPSGAFDRVELLVNRITQSLKDNKPSTSDIETLAVGDVSDPTDPLPSRIEELSEPLQRLEALLPSSDAALIVAHRQLLDSKGSQIKTKYLTLITTPLMQQAADKAKRDMKYPRKLFNELAYEANLIEVSPVVAFDVARISQQGQRVRDVRYAAGGGLRVSFFSLELTSIYSWNIHRRPGEGKGALLFTFGISNLFR